MRKKIMLIMSIFLLIVGIIFLWIDKHEVGTDILIIVMLLNLIRGIVDLRIFK